jgi:rubrerythrin
MNLQDQPFGLSVWERELYDRLMRHMAEESEVLERYGLLAAGSEGHVKFLLELIAEDESRHHRLFQQWAEAVRSMATLVPSDDGLPYLVRESDPATLIPAIDALLDVERRDSHDLKALEKSLKDVRQTTVWPLLVDLMILDTEKHVRILEFLRRHAQKSLKTARSRS